MMKAWLLTKLESIVLKTIYIWYFSICYHIYLKKYIGKVDKGYLLDNEEFVGVLLNNIRPKQMLFASPII